MGKLLAQASATVGKLEDGTDGKTSYIHVAYSNSADGSVSFSTTDSTGRAYIGTLTDFVEPDSTNPADYTWSLVKGTDGKDGANGLPGPKGADGRTSYVHFAYANSADGKSNFSVTDPAGRAYVGTLTDFVEPDSTNPSDYTWSLIKGADGKNGADGAPGPKGADGRTSYIHIAYANSADGKSNFSTTDSTGRAYVGTLTDFVEPDSTNPTDYTWSLIKGADGKDGADGLPGPKGADGRTSYIHFAYANSADGKSNFSTTDPTGRAYVGTLTDFVEPDSTNPTDYTWSLIKGADGKNGANGAPGPKGADGKTSYIHVAYANSADGSVSFSTTDSTGRAYIGTLTDFVEQDSTKYSDYTWSLVKGADGKNGADGAPGPKGADGRTSYVHVAYANSADGKSSFSTTDPTDRAYIGTLTDFVEQDSTNPADYTWSLAKGSDGKDGANGLPGPKGADGRTSYVHFAYANSADGSSNFSVTDPTGRAYVGTLTDFVEPDSTKYTDYTWSLIKGADGKDGANGLPGPKGADGRTSYVHFAYANSADGRTSFSTTDPTGRAYVGTLTDFVEPDSTNPADYTWSLIKGADGKNGANGAPGPKGADGKTSYIHVAYANSADGSASFSTTDPTGRAYVGTLTDFVEQDSTKYSDYTWSLVKGADGKDGANGLPGPKGADGRTSYVHFAYANSADGKSSFSVTDPAGRAYVGTLTDFVEPDSTNPADYTWSLIKGADGKNGANGAPGPKGADGKTSYIHVAYANSADGSDRFTTVYPNLNLLTGTSGPFVMGFGIPNTTWDATNKVSKISLPLTAITREVLPQGNGFPYTYNPGVTYTQSVYISTDAPLTGTPISFTWFTGQYGHNTAGVDNLVKVSTNVYRATSTYTWPSNKSATNGRNIDLFNLTQVFDFTKGTFLQFYKPKLEIGSTTTPWIPSASEVTNADWPSYIGQYTDFTQADSTNPTDYTWSKIKGADGKSVWSYPYNRGANRPGNWWSDLKPAPTTDNPPKVGDTIVDMIGNMYQITNVVVGTSGTGGGTFDYGSLLTSIRGADGAQGPKGDSVTVTSTSIQYAISTSGTSTPTQWSDSVLAPQQGKFLWTRTTVTFSDGKSTVSYSIAFSGSDGKSEDLSAIISSNTPPASPKANQFWNDTSVVPNMLKVYRSGNGWVVYQFSAENIASRAITTDKLSVNAVKAANIDMNEVTYQVSDSSKNLAKNTSFSDASGLGNSTGWTLSSGVKVVQDVLGDTNGILIPAGTTATIVNTLWDNTDAISNYVLGMWIKSAGVVTVTVGGVTSVLGGTHPITTSGDGVWNKKEIKYASTSASSQLTLTITAVKDTYLARVMLSRRDTKLDGMWLPAPEDGMLTTAKLNDQVTQNFSLSNGQLKSVISNLNSGYSSSFTQNADGTINQITKGNDLVTAINTSPAGVYIKGDRINLDGTVRVTQDFYALGGNFKNLNASNINAGKLKADYIDVATVVAQGLSTTNASIEKTLTMGNDGLITANLQSQTLTYTDTLPLGKGATSFPYTSVGTYKLDKTGFTISSKATFNGDRPIVNVGGRAFGLKYYEPRLYMNDATITLSSSNATGQETSQTVDGTAIPQTVLTITPYVISMTGGSQYTRMFTNGISTSGQMSSDTLYVSPTTSKYMITMSKGNITMPGMAGDGSKTKGFRTAHIQWSAWWGQKFDVFREGDMVYGTVMQGASQDIPANTISDEALPVGYRPVWQDSVINVINYLGRDTGVYVRGDGRLGSMGRDSAPFTHRWSFSYVSADPFPYGDVYGQ